MKQSRRTFLATVGATAAVAGCVNFNDSQPPPGQIIAGEQVRSPISDGTLSGINQSWPTAQFNAQNSGCNLDLSKPAVTHAQVKWHNQVADEEDALVDSPSLYDGSVFVTTDRALIVLNASTGKEQWSVSLEQEGVTTPTVTERHVYLGTVDKLVAVNRHTQSIDWVREMTTNQSYLGAAHPRINGAPTVADGIILVTTYYGVLYAFEADTGRQRWATTVTTLPDDTGTPGADNTPFFEGPPAIAHGHVYAANVNGYLYAFDAVTGDQQWRVKSTGGFQPGPTVIDDTVYAVSQVELLAIDAINGTVRWRFREDSGSMKESAIVLSDTIYVASGDSYGSLAITALDRQSRSVHWRVEGRPQASFSAGPHRLYVPLYGNLVAIDRNQGTVEWEMHTESVIGGPPIVTDGGVITADERGSIYGIGSANRN